MSYLDRLQARAAENSAVAEPSKGAKGTSDPIAGSVHGHFSGSATFAEGLRRLSRMPPPRITRPEVWHVIVADALRLERDGWGMQALALGWSPLDLWGCSSEPGGNPRHDGLAVWIDGRRVLLIDDASCIVEAPPNSRAVFYRPSAEGAIFLWDLGKS